MTPIRLGIFGCGAVVEKSYLPTLAAMTDIFSVCALVDRDLDQAQRLAQLYDVPAVSDTYDQVAESVDAVLVALPNYLHFGAGVSVLESGKSVLIEKPMTINFAEANELSNLARKSPGSLTVAQLRRYFDSDISIRSIVQSGILGDISEVDYREGGVYAWPIRSESAYDPKCSGGGVFMDLGSHVLDTLRWVFGELSITSYEDDAKGGVESDCFAVFTNKESTIINLHLSRIRQTGNRIRIAGSKGLFEQALFSKQFEIKLNDGTTIQGQHHFEKEGIDMQNVVMRQLMDWARRLQSIENSAVDGEFAQMTIQLIEQGYSIRKSLNSLW